MAIESEQLLGRWVHAHEEDSQSEMVLRAATDELPPSRGRLELELLADGSLIEGHPGPADQPTKSTGHWELAGDELVIRPESGSEWRASVMSADPDRLVLSKPR